MLDTEAAVKLRNDYFAGRMAYMTAMKHQDAEWSTGIEGQEYLDGWNDEDAFWLAEFTKHGQLDRVRPKLLRYCDA